MQAIAAAFEASLTKEGSSLTMQDCCFHEKLLKTVARRDTIISFNYDCLIDHTLRQHGSDKWNARYGYGFNLGSHGTKLKGDANWQPERPAPRASTIKLLKLHGSLHFQIKEPAKQAPRVQLKSRPYTQQQGTMHFTIIPPEANKQFDHGVFRNLWKQAGIAIHRSNTVVLIGYSLPPTDLHSTALLRTSVRHEGLSSLVVVNPDKEARRRTRDILRRGIHNHTRVLSFDTLEEFVSAPDHIWRA